MKTPSLIPKNRIKGYSGTWGLIIFIAAHAYVSWPIEPWMPTVSELHEIVGMPKYKNTSTIQMSDIDFTVNGVRLNCSLGQLDGRNACELFSKSVDVKTPVRATYFWMPTRLWYGYRVLHTLEQGERLIISPQQSYEMYQISNRTEWKFYFQILAFLGVTAGIVCFLERNINKSTNVKGQ